MQRFLALLLISLTMIADESRAFEWAEKEPRINTGRNTKISNNTQVTEELLKKYKIVMVINTAWDGRSHAERKKRDPKNTMQTLRFFKNGVFEREFVVSTALNQHLTTPKVIGHAQEYNQHGELVSKPVYYSYFAETFKGTYAPNMLFPKFVSPTWKDAQMPHVVFFNYGIGTHQAPTKEKEKDLGKRASGGCVRLSPADAKFIYDEVLAVGEGCQVTQYAGFYGIACRSYDAVFVVH